MPMIMITGQKAIKTARQARFQIVDIVGAWATEKHERLRKYIDAAHGARAKYLPPRGNGGAVVNYVTHSLAPTIEPVANLCASGVLERFKGLRFATVEAGIGEYDTSESERDDPGHHHQRSFDTFAFAFAKHSHDQLERTRGGRLWHGVADRDGARGAIGLTGRGVHQPGGVAGPYRLEHVQGADHVGVHERPGCAVGIRHRSECGQVVDGRCALYDLLY